MREPTTNIVEKLLLGRRGKESTHVQSGNLVYERQKLQAKVKWKI